MKELRLAGICDIDAVWRLSATHSSQIAIEPGQYLLQQCGTILSYIVGRFEEDVALLGWWRTMAQIDPGRLHFRDATDLLIS